MTLYYVNIQEMVTGLSSTQNPAVCPGDCSNCPFRVDTLVEEHWTSKCILFNSRFSVTDPLLTQIKSILSRHLSDTTEIDNIASEIYILIGAKQ